MSEIKVDKLQGTSGSDTAITLSGANATVGGTLAVTGVHTVGENAIYDSEGGAVTQNLVQGLAKAWTFCTDNVITDSLNTSSSADNGAGAYTITLSNNTATANVAGSVTCNENQNANGHRSENSTSTYKIRLKDTSGNGQDVNSGATVHGDLA